MTEEQRNIVSAHQIVPRGPISSDVVENIRDQGEIDCTDGPPNMTVKGVFQELIADQKMSRIFRIVCFLIWQM